MFNRITRTLIVLCIATSGAAEAYDEITVADGTTVSGVVRLDGAVPKPKGYNLTTMPDPIYCGRISDGHGWRLLQPFEIGSDGAFRGVVVFLEGIEKGKAFPDLDPPRIEAKDCRFLPFITLVRDQYAVSIVNMDPAMHDIQGYETSHLGPRVLFNVPLPISSKYPQQASAHVHKHYEGPVVAQTVHMTKGRRVFTMQCGFHAYMESWALVQQHPYYAISDEQGRFQLTDVPPGTYRLKVWHPYVHENIAHTITILPKTPLDLTLNVPAPTGRLYANQMVENPYNRYKITENEQTQIIPTLEEQAY